MVKTCKSCGKKIGLFEEHDISEKGDIICKECNENIRAQQEQAQKQKEEEEYKAKLEKALSKNPRWEYRIVNLNISNENEEMLNKMGLEGWQLAAAINSSIQAQKQAQSPEKEKNEQNQQQPNAETSSANVFYIFKRKI
jgi:uncharacterized Zn finger protein (UPF0148 family)